MFSAAGPNTAARGSLNLRAVVPSAAAVARSWALVERTSRSLLPSSASDASAMCEMSVVSRVVEPVIAFRLVVA